MAGLTRIPWWRWIPLPWRRWGIVLLVDAADEVPARLPQAGTVLVGAASRPSWVAFDCPCGRGHRVMLNLDRRRQPYWLVKQARPLTLSPSVDDLTAGNRCHYWVQRGRVMWVRHDRDEK